MQMLKIIVINTILILLTITRLNSQTIKIYYKTLLNNQTLSENFEPSYYLGTENNSIFVYGKDTSDLTDKYSYGGLIAIKSDSIGNVFYKDYAKQLYIYKEIVPLGIVSTDTLPNIEWQIIDESKEILNYNCKQATCMYSGRKYIVWFTEELNFNASPWKLHGLHGVVLEVQEINKMISFYADSIKLFNETLLIEAPDTNSAISFKEYKNIYRERFGGFTEELENEISNDNFGLSKEFKIEVISTEIKILEQSLIME